MRSLKRAGMRAAGRAARAAANTILRHTRAENPFHRAAQKVKAGAGYLAKTGRTRVK
ncbi:MAG: hypothetical protein E6700_09630 [Winkia neuii]|uniref:hypothetical protein n=1 Tax=Winkia TaxID=2692118 RepID=UPI00255210E2|nr:MULTISPECIES: hypothetical protein [Winkia]MDK8224161.1 hypothetical protein [Winkia sp. UMB750B]MDU3135815.1 hypothetical protein [Winkia neuii]